MLICASKLPGPNWIHGTDHNPILDLARETNTIACSTGEGSLTYDEHGKLLEPEVANAASDVFWSIVADAFKYSNENDSSFAIPPDRSLKDFFVDELEAKQLGDADKKVVLQMAELWGAFIGDPIERQSLKYFWLEECIDGGKPGKRVHLNNEDLLARRISRPIIWF